MLSKHEADKSGHSMMTLVVTGVTRTGVHEMLANSRSISCSRGYFDIGAGEKADPPDLLQLNLID